MDTLSICILKVCILVGTDTVVGLAAHLTLSRELGVYL